MQKITFFSDWINIVFVILIICIFIGIIFSIKSKELDKTAKFFLIAYLFAMVIGLSDSMYSKNYKDYPPLKNDIKTFSYLNVNINTFKKHEHRLPKEKDFYLSGFLNDSGYFQIVNSEKIFNPINKSDFKIIDNDNSLSFNYTHNYDKTSFIKTGQAYRYCLNFPVKLKEMENIKDVKITINGKDIDYKKATKESMKDICYSDKPNSFTLTFF